MSSINNNDYKNAYNQLKLNNANSLLNGTGSPSIAGISGDLLNQWAMLGANSKAYKALLEAEKTGSVKQNQNYSELLSDKYFNDYYDSSTGKLTKPTYTPSTNNTPEIDKESTSGDVLNDMRTLALAAIKNPNSLTSTHYDFFEKMRASIASSLVTGGNSGSTSVTTKEAGAATVAKKVDYRLITDDQSFTVAGNKGEKTYNFASGASLEDVVAAINADSGDTGVKAELAESEGGKYEIKLTSATTGTDAFVRVDQGVGDLFAAAGGSISGKGTAPVTEEAEEVATGTDSQAAMAVGLYTGKLFGDQTFTIQGRDGAETFSFEAGATAEDIAKAINDKSAGIGVTAEVIYNGAGEAEGIGLLASKAGTGHYIQVKQDKGDMFAAEGKTVSVAGSSIDTKNADGPAISNLNDLGKVHINGETFSFADLVQGGKASLSKNPDAALAVLDQAIKDIYDGKAELKGFDPTTVYMPGLAVNDAAKSSTNTMEIYNYGSDAMSSWLNKYVKADS